MNLQRCFDFYQQRPLVNVTNQVKEKIIAKKQSVKKAVKTRFVQLNLLFKATPIIHGDFYRSQVCSNYDGKTYSVIKERLSEQGSKVFKTFVEIIFDRFEKADDNRRAAYRHCENLL